MKIKVFSFKDAKENVITIEHTNKRKAIKYVKEHYPTFKIIECKY